MNEYHRTIVDFLRGHGARDVRVVPGGRHPHVDFVFRDKAFNLAVHRDPPGYSDAAIIKVKELKVMLGEADIVAPREARRLDNMTPMPTMNAPPASMGSIAMYGDNLGKLRLRFFPPEDAIALLGRAAIITERMARDTWLLSTGTGARPTFRTDGKKFQLDSGNAQELTRGYDTPFGVTPAEYVAVDGKVMVRLLTDQIRPVEVRRPNRTNPVRGAEPTISVTEVQGTAVGRIVSATLATGANHGDREYPDDLPTTANGTRWIEPKMPDPRAILAAISKIEATTPYRLMKIKDGGWAWQAPIIRLEDKT